MALVNGLPPIQGHVQALIESIKKDLGSQPLGIDEINALVCSVASAAHEGLGYDWPTASIERIQRRSGAGSDLDWSGIERIVARPTGIYVQFAKGTAWEVRIYEDPFRFYFEVLKSPIGLMAGESSDNRLKFHISVLEPLERRVISHLTLRAFDREGQCIESYGFTFSLTALLRALEKILPRIGELILVTGRQDRLLQIDAQSALDPFERISSVGLFPSDWVGDLVKAFEQRFPAFSNHVKVE